LPSRRAVRLESLTTRAKLKIERNVAEMKGDGVTDQIHTIGTCLKAYTPNPFELVFVERPVLDGSGNPVMRDGKPAMAPTSEVDVDATLEQIPAAAWVPVTFESLTVDGPGHVLELFPQIPDWHALRAAVGEISGINGANPSLLAGKA